MLITLYNYRCFDQINLQLPSSNFIILDDNGSGKTSVLSAFYSLHTAQPLPMTKFGQYLKIGKEYFGIGTEDLAWFLSGKISPSGRVTTKHSKPQIPAPTLLKTILTYQPTDNYWLSQSRSAKLSILDNIISQTSPDYDLLLKHLDKLTKAKLELIKKTNQTGQNDMIMVEYFGRNIELVSNKIWAVRHKFLLHIQTNLPTFSHFIKTNIANWQVVWQITDIYGKKQSYRDLYDNKIRVHTTQQSDSFGILWQRELIAEKVLFGANRDDFEIVGNNLGGCLNIEQILSRGEMRLFVLWIKKLNTIPSDTIWLLDDIFNELDDCREQILLDSIFENTHQIIATGTRCNTKNLLKVKVSDILL